MNNNRYSGAIQVITARENMLILTDQLQWDVKFIKDAIGKIPIGMPLCYDIIRAGGWEIHRLSWHRISRLLP